MSADLPIKLSDLRLVQVGPAATPTAPQPIQEVCACQRAGRAIVQGPSGIQLKLGDFMEPRTGCEDVVLGPSEMQARCAASCSLDKEQPGLAILSAKMSVVEDWQRI